MRSMRPGPKLKVFNEFELAKAITLIREESVGLKAIAKELHTHWTTLYRNLRTYYGEHFDEKLEFYRSRRGFRKGTEIGKEWRFKKNVLRGICARKWRPIGSTMTKKYRYGPKKKKYRLVKLIKISDEVNGNNWVIYARWLWEQNFGPIPKGMKICHLDGDRANDNLDNLALMKQGDIVRYLESRFPKKLEQRKRRNQAAQKKRYATGSRVKIKRTFWECAQCGAEYPTKEDSCSKCGSSSFEQVKVKIKCA